MEQELDAPETNHTLELTNLPIEKNNFWVKWMYKLKLNYNETIDRFKARLVAKRHN